MRNRLLLARKHLPWAIAGVHVALWTAFTVKDAIRARGLQRWFGAWRDGMRMPVERNPLPWRTLLRLHRDGGRVFW
jgi:hypothetical protein